jgi:hypothetical protein
MDALRGIIDPRITGQSVSNAGTDLSAPARPGSVLFVPGAGSGQSAEARPAAHRRGYPLDVAETIGPHPEDLRRVLEGGHRD